MKEKNYYSEIKLKIISLMKEKNYKESLKLIDDEMNMPYIPMEFENFLIEQYSKIPQDSNFTNTTLSLENILDLVLKLENKKNDSLFDLLEQLKKFNLSEFNDEINYFFSKSNNNKNKSFLFNLLSHQKTDIELEYGNPSKEIPIQKTFEYQEDLKKLNSLLDKMPNLIGSAIILLDEIYLSKLLGQKISEENYDVVLFVLSRIFKIDEILNFIDDLEIVKKKIENYNSIENL